MYYLSLYLCYVRIFCCIKLMYLTVYVISSMHLLTLRIFLPVCMTLWIVILMADLNNNKQSHIYVCMYVCVCMYACMHACMYVCMYTVYIDCSQLDVSQLLDIGVRHKNSCSQIYAKSTYTAGDLVISNTSIVVIIIIIIKQILRNPNVPGSKHGIHVSSSP